MDQYKQKLTFRDWMIYTVLYMFVAAAAAWLFYDSFFSMPVFAVFFPFFIKAVKKMKGRKRNEELTEGFLKTLISVSTSLSAGMSPENAFLAAAYDMEKLYGKRSDMVKELTVINSRVRMGQSLCDALRDFAKRVRIPEIYDFSVVFRVAKDNGANFSTVISSCVNMMETKRQAEAEARILIRAKQYEQRVMCIIPPGILAYLRFSSGSFIGVLYHGPAGIAVMTGCLFTYVLAVCLSEKIGDVKV